MKTQTSTYLKIYVSILILSVFILFLAIFGWEHHWFTATQAPFLGIALLISVVLLHISKNLFDFKVVYPWLNKKLKRK